MALTDELATIAARAKEAEARAVPLSEKARAELEQEVSRAGVRSGARRAVPRRGRGDRREGRHLVNPRSPLLAGGGGAPADERERDGVLSDDRSHRGE